MGAIVSKHYQEVSFKLEYTGANRVCHSIYDDLVDGQWIWRKGPWYRWQIFAIAIFFWQLKIELIHLPRAFLLKGQFGWIRLILFFTISYCFEHLYWLNLHTSSSLYKKRTSHAYWWNKFKLQMVYTSTLIKEKIVLLQPNVPPMNFRTAAKVKIYFL